MGNKCKTCKHPKVVQVNKDLVKMWKTGESFCEISRRYHLPYDSLWRHFFNCIPRKLLVSEEAKKRLEASRLSNEMEDVYQHIKKILRACDRYLEDPEKPGEYYLGPRGSDVEVVYEVKEGSTSIVVKKDLLEIIAELEERYPDRIFKEISWKHADPRKLILEAAKEARGYIETAGKFAGKIKDIQVNIGPIEIIKQFADWWRPRFPKEYDEFIRDVELQTGIRN